MRVRGKLRGFTLIEVMVALAVVALALPAVVMTLYQQVDGTEHLRDKSLAQMVAANKLAELRLLTQARGRLITGNESGNSELAGRDWSWQISSTQTEMDGFFRVEIAIRPGRDNQKGPSLHRLTAFMSGIVAGESGEPGDDAG